MKLSIIIPCYNESSTILSLIDAVKQSPIKDREIIIVDDGSKDGTRDILRELRDPEVALFSTKSIKAKAPPSGQASRKRRATSASFRMPTRIRPPGISGGHPADCGRQGRRGVRQPLPKDAASRGVFLAPHRQRRAHPDEQFLHGPELSDMETCYKAFRREVIQSINIRENRFGFEPEVTAKVAKMNLRIYEVGISYYGRTYDEGKKIGWRDGFRAIYCILKYNLWSKR